MAEKIYTIPINEAFDKTLESETPDCPLCLLRRMLEKNEIERITGAAMMEPDVRIETNKKGFCRRHFDMMTGGGGSRLPIALMLESHIAETEKEIFSGGTLFDGKGAKEEEKLARLEASCYVCSRVDDAFSKMLGTVIYLWKTRSSSAKNTRCNVASACRTTSSCSRRGETIFRRKCSANSFPYRGIL